MKNSLQSLIIRTRGVFKPRLSIIGEYISPPRVWERKHADLYMISFPKTGRTWLRMLIKSVLHQHLDIPLRDPLEFHEFTDADSRVPRISVVHDDEPHWKRPEQLSQDKSRWYANKRVILVIRDPRDTMVSLYFQMTRRWKVFSPDDYSLQEFIFQPRGGLETMLHYYNIWAKARHVPKELLLVRYEDLHTDPESELERTLNFLGVSDVSSKTISSAVEQNRIENIRKREQDGEFDTKRLRPGVEGDVESLKARRGKVGGFYDYLSESDADRIANRTLQALDPWYGYHKLITNQKQESLEPT